MDMSGMNMPGMKMSSQPMLMPGNAYAEADGGSHKSKGCEVRPTVFTGMIQHHNGALIMVKTCSTPRVPGRTLNCSISRRTLTAANALRSGLCKPLLGVVP